MSEKKLCPEIQRFAEAMQEELDAHAEGRGPHGGWTGANPDFLIALAKEQMAKLETIATWRHVGPGDALKRAAHVANFVMMTFDAIAHQTGGGEGFGI